MFYFPNADARKISGMTEEGGGGCAENFWDDGGGGRRLCVKISGMMGMGLCLFDFGVFVGFGEVVGELFM
jgi:hypothetical protein